REQPLRASGADGLSRGVVLAAAKIFTAEGVAGTERRVERLFAPYRPACRNKGDHWQRTEAANCHRTVAPQRGAHIGQVRAAIGRKPSSAHPSLSTSSTRTRCILV